ncbi:MAG: AtpZ/AtpI family protein [Saprospiraceae bacterium]|nr:AtpZ/AtpI family protein [Saprospiraceae bacterium]
MAATLMAGAFIGQKLDAYFQLDRPYLTALITLLALFAGFYLSLKDLLFKK